MTTSEVLHPWDDGAMTRRLLRVVPRVVRCRLDEVDVAAVPGVYVTFFASRQVEPKLGPLVAQGRYPSYVGVAASSLADRIGRHRATLRAVDDIDESDTYVAVVPCASTASARYAESALIDRLHPVLNGLGFGARPPGSTRRQRCSAFDALFPGRQWAQRPTLIDQARAQLQVVSHLARLDPGGLRWPALVDNHKDRRGPSRPNRRDRSGGVERVRRGTQLALPTPEAAEQEASSTKVRGHRRAAGHSGTSKKEAML